MKNTTGARAKSPAAPPQNPAAPAEPHHDPLGLLFAATLRWGVWLGIVWSVGAYGLYLWGWPKPHLAISQLTQHMGEQVGRFSQATHTPTGWGWAGLLPASDMLSLAAVAFLSAVAILAYLAVLPLYLKRGDRLYAGLVAAQVAIFALAASGIIHTGH